VEGIWRRVRDLPSPPALLALLILPPDLLML
jgi:hypothetical protein